jgi:hypothetical protein
MMAQEMHVNAGFAVAVDMVVDVSGRKWRWRQKSRRQNAQHRGVQTETRKYIDKLVSDTDVSTPTAAALDTIEEIPYQVLEEVRNLPPEIAMPVTDGCEMSLVIIEGSHTVQGPTQ